MNRNSNKIDLFSRPNIKFHFMILFSILLFGNKTREKGKLYVQHFVISKEFEI